MKLQIKEFAELTGVSVRTLHYYDEIGLLKPCFVDGQNGYRFYDEISLERMQEILFYRELDFSLKSVGEILASPNYDKQKALAEQRRLLTLKKERLERLLAALEQAEKGEITMSAFDNSEYEAARQQYEDEAKLRWGDTAAYKESQAKTAGYSKDQWNDVLGGLNGIFAEFAELMKCGESGDSDTAQRLAEKLRDYRLLDANVREQLEEEIRVFYVACTRAEKQIIIANTKSKAQVMQTLQYRDYASVSRWLLEMDKEV